MGEILSLLGTHGTCLTHALQIKQSKKMRVSESGHAGEGAYFWAYETNKRYAIELAECWWAFWKHKGKYQDCSDDRCAVLDAKIRKPDDQVFLDATGMWFREALDTALRASKKTESDLPAVTEFLIQELQEEAKTQFHIVKIDIKTPSVIKGREQVVAQIVSRLASAYVVKKSGLDLIQDIDLVNGEQNERIDGESSSENKRHV